MQIVQCYQYAVNSFLQKGALIPVTTNFADKFVQVLIN